MRKIGKLTTGYVKRGKYANPKTVPFEEILPLSLRNYVSAKGNKTKTASCIQEMSVLFACLKKNDFKESSCVEEISKFQNCYSNFKQQLEAKKLQEKKGILIPSEKKLTYKQASELLKRHS